MTPLHHAVVTEGFLEYARAQTGAVFPTVKLDQNGRRSAASSKLVGIGSAFSAKRSASYCR
jgi:hypothetical protein